VVSRAESGSPKGTLLLDIRSPGPYEAHRSTGLYITNTGVRRGFSTYLRIQSLLICLFLGFASDPVTYRLPFEPVRWLIPLS
jgi:hypothetical protein